MVLHVKTVGENTLEYVKENVDQILTVEDDELIGAFLDMVENHKMIVENSGLLSVAALKQLDLKGKKVVSILSGGNMDVITMSSIVQHGLIQRDRISLYLYCFRISRVNWYVLRIQSQRHREMSSNWSTISLSAQTVMQQWSFVLRWIIRYRA